MPIDSSKINSEAIDQALSTSYDTVNPFNQEVAYKPFERYKGYSINLDLSNDELEDNLSQQQSYWDRLQNDLTVSGANAAAMFGSVLMSTKDLLSGDFTLDGTESESQKELFDWRKSIEEENVNFESNYDKENPILSMILPTALTGFKSTKGWGELMKSGAYGIGAMGAIALQEVAITAATYGTGTIPSLGINLSRLLRLPKDIASVGKTMLTSAQNYKNLRNQFKAVSSAMLAVDSIKAVELGVNTTKFLSRGLAASYGEAAFEGFESKENLKQIFIDKIKSQYGREPNTEEMMDIESKSQEAASMRFYTNLGLLTLTGGYEIGQVFKPKNAIKNLLDEGSHLGLKRVFIKDKAFKFDSNKFLLKDRDLFKSKTGKAFKKTIENVGNIGKNLKSLDFALMEGVEEFGQLWIDKSAENHYIGRFNNDVNTTVLNSIYSGLDESLNKDGFIAALSGIMGGTMQSIMFQSIPKQVKQYLNKDSVSNKKEQLLNFNKKIDNLNTVLKNTDVQDLIKAVNVKSFNGKLTDKIANTKDQTYSQFLKNLNPKEDLTTESLALFNQVSNFSSLGLGSVYSEYLELQIDDSFQNQQDAQKLKTYFKDEISKVSNIYEKLNTSFPNPYVQTKDQEGNPYKYERYKSWKDHLARYMYLQNTYKNALSNITTQDIKNSDIFFDIKSFQTRVKDSIKNKEESLKTFESGVELTNEQKKQTSSLRKEVKNLNEILDLAESKNEFLFDRLFETLDNTVIDDLKLPFSSGVYVDKLSDIASLRFKLANISKSYTNLINVKDSEEAVKKDEVKEKEGKVLNEKINTELTNTSNTASTSESTDNTSESTDNTSEKKETESKPVEKKTNMISDIRSKFVTGIFELELDSNGDFVVKKDDSGNSIRTQNKDKIEFLNNTFPFDIDNILKNYKIVKVKSTSDELIPVPQEPGLVFNTKPTYHYALIKKDSSTFEEIIRLQSPDSILINPKFLKEFNQFKLNLKEDSNIYDLALAIKKVKNLDTTGVMQLITQNKSNSQIPLADWADYVIDQFERTELLVTNRTEEEILSKLSKFFLFAPHITEMRVFNPDYFKANNIPAHYIIHKDGVFHKPMAIVNNKKVTVWATNENGDVINITDKIKLTINLDKVKSNFFAVVPSYSYTGSQNNTVPLLRTKYDDIVKNIIDTFKDEGEAGVRKLFIDDIYTIVDGLTSNPSIFVTKKDKTLSININQQLPEGKSKTVATVKILENDDGTYTFENKNNVGFYPDTKEPLNAYGTLVSDLYKVAQPYSNYKIQLRPLPLETEDKSFVKEKLDADEEAISTATQTSEVPIIEEPEPGVLEEEVENNEITKGFIVKLNYDLKDLSLTKQYEVLDENSINKFLEIKRKPQTIAKFVKKALEKGIIKEINTRPSERNLNTLTLDIDKQIEYHLKNCHDLS
jgi:hypothetical protein